MGTFDITKLLRGIKEVDAALRYGPPRCSEVVRLLAHLEDLRLFMAACEANREEIEKVLRRGAE